MRQIGHFSGWFNLVSAAITGKFCSKLFWTEATVVIGSSLFAVEALPFALALWTAMGLTETRKTAAIDFRSA